MTGTTHADIPDTGSAVALGLERRPQLRLLRAVIGEAVSIAAGKATR